VKIDSFSLTNGDDHYMGVFKDGFPYGKGLYRWNSGDFYECNWYRGKMDGNIF